jgi:hypothetical protein
MIRTCCFVSALVSISVFTGCPKQDPSSTYKNPSSIAKVGEGDHEQEGHGPALELGTATIGDWSTRAARDEDVIAAGGESPVDVWLTGGKGKISAVRFWIGTEDAAGSVKALAAIEDAADPTHWHTHVEIPKPLPAGCKLWVEVVDESGAKSVGSFDLKM